MLSTNGKVPVGDVAKTQLLEKCHVRELNYYRAKYDIDFS